jgi:putative tricarboxylic transport membrane protein
VIKTDRIFGVVVIVVALAFIVSAYNLPPGNLFDKLGPKAFPYMIGAGLIISSLSLVFKPDPEPEWPAARTLLSLGLATAVLVAYTYSLKPLGFIVPTVIAAGILSYQIEPNWKRSILAGLGLSFGLFTMFKSMLGLSLIGISDGAAPYLPFIQPILDALDFAVVTLIHWLEQGALSAKSLFSIFKAAR